MNAKKLVLSVVVVAAISTGGFTEGGVVGRDPESSPQATAMGTPIGPDPHPVRCVPASKLDPEASRMSAGSSDIAAPHPEHIAQGNPSNPIPHLTLSNPWMKLDPESDGIPGVGEVGVGQPEPIAPGGTTNPVPHFQPALFLVGLVFEIDSILGVEANGSVEQVFGAFNEPIDGLWF